MLLIIWAIKVISVNLTGVTLGEMIFKIKTLNIPMNPPKIITGLLRNGVLFKYGKPLKHKIIKLVIRPVK